MGYYDEPQTKRLIDDLNRAKAAFDAGDMNKYRAIMKMVGSICYSFSVERKPNSPMPEKAA